ncbi:hypothetical protein F383_17439 [Gossypium arboreum]|uniref:Uncharacterized protein n=1 Tax=Gossypium arboreum TaxID=29729 RepID=A0A0B0NQD0_GOSAR|nr:hypothetical protein F383_17439 [Gossypium arboreum]
MIREVRYLTHFGQVGVSHHTIQLSIGTFEFVDNYKYGMYRLVLSMINMVTWDHDFGICCV